MSTAQGLFAQQSAIEGNGYGESDRYWFELLYSKWLDPVMALIACYELIRRGAAEQHRDLMDTVLRNMRQYFPGFADTAVIAGLLNQAADRPGRAPLLMDGVLMLEDRGILPLPDRQLDYGSIWTSWRDALSLRRAELVAGGA
jgi:hypothetical protein